MLRHGVLLLLFFTLTALPCAAQRQSLHREGGKPSITLILTPGGTGSGPTYIDVAQTLSGIPADPSKPFLHVAEIMATEPGVPYTADDVHAADDAGPLPLTVTTDPDSHAGFVQQRTFTAGRASTGDITLRYRADAAPAGSPRRSGPPFDLRCEGGGISGAGSCFLILPTETLPTHAAVHWDLSRLPPGMRAVSSLGLGDFTTDGPLDSLEDCYFLAGALRSAQPNAGHLPFNGFWLGTPHFDAAALTTWAARDYTSLQQFFHGRNAPPFFMLIRPGSIPGSGGAAFPHSFLLSAGTRPEPLLDTQFVLAHELVHPWVGELDEGAGNYSWYAEGFAEYYMARMPFRAGLIDARAFLGQVNEIADAYYSNPMNRLPNSQVGARFWSSPSVRKIPYRRGFLYLTLMDAEIRAASHGKRSLDDVLAAMLASKRAGKGYSEKTWRTLLSRELGKAQAERDFRAMTSGQLIVLPSDAFGPRFQRVTTTVRLPNGTETTRYHWILRQRLRDVPLQRHTPHPVTPHTPHPVTPHTQH